MRHSKQILFLFLAIILFSLAALPALAKTEVVYPVLPGLPDINKGNILMPQYIAYFFGLAMYLSGAICAISLAVGGIQLAASMGSPEMETEARDRIRGSLIGLVLLMASVIILKTINPLFVKPNITPMPGVVGIYYVNAAGDEKPAPPEESDASNIPSGYTRLLYKCAGGSTPPILLVWGYNKKYFIEDGGATTVELECNKMTTLPPGSFRYAYQTQGIYYFANAGCQGFRSDPQTNSGNIDPIFAKKVGSIRIVNNTGGVNYYGVIFHQSNGDAGACTPPALSSEPTQCINLPTPNISTATVFTASANPGLSGKGVVFYSDAFGYYAGADYSGYNDTVASESVMSAYGMPIAIELNPKLIRFNYTGTSATEDDINMCRNKIPSALGYITDLSSAPTFYNCPGAIELNGDYLVAIYSADASIANPSRTDACQIFTSDIGNFSSEVKVKAAGHELGKIYIIPQ